MMRTRNDESGAVLAIVALSLIALMGMAVLVVDVGGLLVMKRRLVTTADAAALAAAQQCAQNKGDAVARSEAAEVAVGNVDTSIGQVAFRPSCSASNGEASTRYRAGQQLFFAPILGLEEDMTVSAPAKAIWGPAGSGFSVPLMVGAPQFAGNGTGQCGFPPPGPPSGQTCAFWYDTDQIGNANWGWVNLHLDGNKKGWDVPAAQTSCPAVGSERSNWIENNYPKPLPLNWPAPTYVCADNGFNDADWEDLRDIIPTTRVFPVNDPNGAASIAAGGPPGHGQVDSRGNLAPPPASPHKYDMIGFTALRITALYDGNDPRAVGTPGIAGVPAAGGSCTDKRRFTRDEIFAIYGMNAAGCPNGILPDVVVPGVPFVYTETTGRIVTKIPKVRCTTLTPTPLPSGCDFYYDPVTFEITWKAATESNVFVDFNWSRAAIPGTVGTEGACGRYGLPPPPDTMAKLQDKCLVTQWVGFQSSGLDPGNGADFGVRAIRLAE